MKKIRRLLVAALVMGMLLGNCMMVSATEYIVDCIGPNLKTLQEGDVLYPGDVIVLPISDDGRDAIHINGERINTDYTPVDPNVAHLDSAFYGWHVTDKCSITKIESVYNSPGSTYYITVEYLPPEDEPMDQPVCEHTYARTTIVPADFETDEVIGEKCTKCGAVRADGVRVVRPNSAYGYFLNDMSEQILDAPENGEVFMETETWVSFSSKVMEALAARPDVSLTVEYRYEGKYYTLTIPAGYDVMSLLDENGYAGFRWVDQFVGGYEIEK